MSTPVHDPLLGQLIGERYRVSGCIASGGMATVYRAVDTRLERPVALKILHPHLSDNDAFVARLRREAKAAAQLAHPHVVGVLDHGEQRSGRTLAYLVMEYVPGTTLRAVLAHAGALELSQCLNILDPLLEGLGAAHERGLVHRDVKPENVLIGQDGRLRVADFGLARAATTTTGTGSLLGTVAYMAPELVLGQPAHAASDMYSVGIVLYELFTGRCPFQGAVPIQVAYQHVNSTVSAPSLLRPDLAGEYDELVQWCTDPEPERRPQDAHALLGELRHIRSRDGACAPLGPVSVAMPPHIDTAVVPEAVKAPTQPVAGRVAEPRAAEALESEATRVRNQERTPQAPTEVFAAPEVTTETVASPSPLGGPACEPTRALERAGPVLESNTPIFRPHSRRRGWLWLLVVLSLIAGAVGLGWYFGSGPGALGTIPDTKGMPKDRAIAALIRAGFASTVDERDDDTVPPGHVLTSQPPPQATQPKTTPVTLQVSRGPTLYPVPSVSGLSRVDAQRTIEQVQLRTQESSEHSDTVPAGQVIRQEPAAGQKRPARSPVLLVVSSGPELRQVPAVTGMPVEQARRVLEQQGLKVTSRRGLILGVTGRVVDQDPEPGQQVPPNTLVTLTVL